MEGTPHLSAPFISCRYNPHITAFMKVVFEQVVVLQFPLINAHHIKVTGCFNPKMTHLDISYNIDRPYNSSNAPLLQHLAAPGASFNFRVFFQWPPPSASCAWPCARIICR